MTSQAKGLLHTGHRTIRALCLCHRGAWTHSQNDFPYLLSLATLIRSRYFLLIIRVDAKRRLKMRFRLIHIILSQINDAEAPFGLGVLGIQSRDFFKCFLRFRQFVLTQRINPNS